MISKLKFNNSNKKKPRNCSSRQQFKQKKLLKSPNLSLLLKSYLLFLSTSSYWILSVLLMFKRNCTWLNSLAIRDSLLFFSIEDLFTAGCAKTSILDATRKVRPSACSRWKMETASEGIPLLSGSHLILVSILETLMHSYLTWLAPANSLPKDQAKIYGARKVVDLFLVEGLMMS